MHFLFRYGATGISTSALLYIDVHCRLLQFLVVLPAFIRYLMVLVFCCSDFCWFGITFDAIRFVSLRYRLFYSHSSSDHSIIRGIYRWCSLFTVFFCAPIVDGTFCSDPLFDLFCSDDYSWARCDTFICIYCWYYLTCYAICLHCDDTNVSWNLHSFCSVFSDSVRYYIHIHLLMTCSFSAYSERWKAE